MKKLDIKFIQVNKPQDCSFDKPYKYINPNHVVSVYVDEEKIKVIAELITKEKVWIRTYEELVVITGKYYADKIYNLCVQLAEEKQNEKED